MRASGDALLQVLVRWLTSHPSTSGVPSYTPTAHAAWQNYTAGRSRGPTLCPPLLLWNRLLKPATDVERHCLSPSITSPEQPQRSLHPAH